MAYRVRIDSIVKDDRFNKYESIQFVGGPNPDGKGRYKAELNTAIQGALDEKWDFYVHVEGHVRDVIVSKSRFGNLYLRTTADMDTPDHLLSLPTCP